MGTFKGYLISCNGDTDNSWILASSYSSVPNQREEIKAIRDENTRDLTRITAQGLKTVIEFQTLPVDLSTKQKIQEFFNSGMVDTLQKKVLITFWNDDVNEYQTKYFYIPNITFNIDYFDEHNIYYQPISIKLVEY